MSTLAEDVRRGLTAERKHLPSVWFYDATGSALFEEITRQPEYYLTETERGILMRHAHDILDAVSPGRNVALVELGAGSAYKTRVLLDALCARQDRVDYVPIDVSATALELAKANVERTCPEVNVSPRQGRNRATLRSLDLDEAETRLVLFLGSSIGNMERADADVFLRDVGEALREQDALLLGTDMVKSPDVLVPAYSDAAGVTKRFNLNLLERLNRELGADFDFDAFDHEAVWNPDLARMESYIVSRRTQTVRLSKLDLDVSFTEGERVHTENSHKYTLDMVRGMADAAGLTVARTWFDEREWFGLHLLKRR